MKEITSDLRTEILMSEDGTKRYALKKVWDPDKPSLAIIMLAPSQAGEICLDTSSMLTINNCHRLGKGSVTIVNLFSKINDFALKEAEAEDPENIRAIVAAAESADCVVLAAGTGKAKNKVFQQRLEQVLTHFVPTRPSCIASATMTVAADTCIPCRLVSESGTSRPSSCLS